MSDLSPYPDLLRAAAPEDFGQWPIYIVPRTVVPAGLWPQNCGGFTSEILDLDLQQHLQDTGQWCGRGYAMAIDTSVFTTPEALSAVVVHEGAHMLLHEEPTDFLSGLEHLCRVAGWQEDEDLWTFFRKYDEGPPVGPPPPPWDRHGADFIRGALHLFYRWPTEFPFQHLNVAGATYGLTRLIGYTCALDDELQTHRTGSIRSILATPAPVEFTQLFERDTKDQY